MLRLTLIVIGIVQLVLGVLFLAVPGTAAELFGLHPPAPVWATWLFAMMAARFLGYAYGMFVAARDPRTHVAWIDTMVIIQAIDWIATIAVLATGELTFRQVSTASFLPVLFIAGLLLWHPRRTAPPVPAR
jgi:hypothetical protein